MKKQIKKIADLGIIDLSKIELMDSIEMFIEIAELSGNLKEEVEKAVEEGKRIHKINDKAYMENWNQSWCKAGVKITPQLHITIPENGNVEYELYVSYQDLEDVDLYDCVRMEIDLSAHISELKRTIFHILVDKFI